MKILATIILIGTVALGAVEGDCTAAVVMGLLFLPLFKKENARGGSRTSKSNPRAGQIQKQNSVSVYRILPKMSTAKNENIKKAVMR